MRRARIAGAIVTAGTVVLLADVVRVAWVNLEARVDALASDVEPTITGALELERRIGDLELIVAPVALDDRGLRELEGRDDAIERVDARLRALLEGRGR